MRRVSSSIEIILHDTGIGADGEPLPHVFDDGHTRMDVEIDAVEVNCLRRCRAPSTDGGLLRQETWGCREVLDGLVSELQRTRARTVGANLPRPECRVELARGESSR
jgi:hypothetical protein